MLLFLLINFPHFYFNLFHEVLCKEMAVAYVVKTSPTFC
jgi:hypothetical protein